MIFLLFEIFFSVKSYFNCRISYMDQDSIDYKSFDWHTNDKGSIVKSTTDNHSFTHYYHFYRSSFDRSFVGQGSFKHYMDYFIYLN